MKQKLQQNLYLKPTINQQMHQSLQILQMSNLDLYEYTAQAMATNPFLEEINKYDDILQNDNNKLEHVSYDMYYQNIHSTNNDIDSLSTSSRINLRNHIIEQINVEFNNDNLRQMIAYSLLDLIQYNGYITDSIDFIANKLNCDVELIEKILHKLQKFDPPGIFARNLEECLSIQLSLQNELTPIMKILLKK